MSNREKIIQCLTDRLFDNSIITLYERYKFFTNWMIILKLWTNIRPREDIVVIIVKDYV